MISDASGNFTNREKYGYYVLDSINYTGNGLTVTKLSSGDNPYDMTYSTVANNSYVTNISFADDNQFERYKLETSEIKFTEYDADENIVSTNISWDTVKTNIALKYTPRPKLCSNFKSL